MTRFQKFCEFHFKLSQKSFIWFPFTFLRPAPNEFITMSRVLVMSLCFGVYFYVFYLLRILVMGDEFSFSWSKLVTFILIFVAWFMLVTRPLWNYWVKNGKSIITET